jgi:hypothetical protein
MGLDERLSHLELRLLEHGPLEALGVALPLTRVTISGPDDGVDPAELARLSGEYPFVEWGILYSSKRNGEPRYPSLGWRVRLGKIGTRMQLSLHLCGQVARDVLEGDTELIGTVDDDYQRIQVNGWRPSGQEFRSVVTGESREFILQARCEEDLQRAAIEISAIKDEALEEWTGSVSVLYDVSGGQGIAPMSWPLPIPRVGTYLGYAGGIGPDNVVAVLLAIGPLAHDFWIDMESGVRTDDRFDLAKVRRVLDLAEPFVRHGQDLKRS